MLQVGWGGGSNNKCVWHVFTSKSLVPGGGGGGGGVSLGCP